MTAQAFGFTKLVVEDLERAELFYCEVFGLLPQHRVTTEAHEFALDEVILSRTADDHKLILARYRNRRCPPAGSAWTGFVVADLELALASVVRSGGAIRVPIHDNPQHHVLAAIASDPDGHLIEIIQLGRS
ncbi:VOC family protein [Novosphingobium sp. JCM 18896]|uniref:VOC family protein n=1 Tax=Novosphingobium sp. JCM 18896 TaxID=2989731 RepID=UPI0022232DD8|nr:VOC family protein [Novosphingobium sp. JCM 18896]MCW1431620.1 VOC family protein [Novosphingobium sp. JCM 18896]